MFATLGLVLPPATLNSYGTLEGDGSRLVTFSDVTNTIIDPSAIGGSWWVILQPTYTGTDFGRSLNITAFLDHATEPDVVLAHYRHVNRGRWFPRYWGWTPRIASGNFFANQNETTTRTGFPNAIDGALYNDAVARGQSFPAMWGSPFEAPADQAEHLAWNNATSTYTTIPNHVSATPKNALDPSVDIAIAPQPLHLLVDIAAGQTLRFRIRELRERPTATTPPTLTATIPTNGEPASTEEIVSLTNFTITMWALKIG